MIFGFYILLDLWNYKSSAGSSRDNYKSQPYIVSGKIIKSTDNNVETNTQII